MNPKKLFPMVVTDKLAETKEFYAEKADFEVVYDMPDCLQVRYGGDSGPELSFLTTEENGPLGKLPVFNGQGLLISIPTPDADEKASELEKRGVTLVSPPALKPWGWKSFLTQDPNGVLLDFFHVPTDNAGQDAAS